MTPTPKTLPSEPFFFCLYLQYIFWENINHKGARQVMGDETNELIKQPHRITALDVSPSLYLCELESPGATYLHFQKVQKVRREPPRIVYPTPGPACYGVEQKHEVAFDTQHTLS